MGRLEDIAARNKHPYRRRGFAVEVPAILLLIILGLLAFTNAASPPAPSSNATEGAPARSPRNATEGAPEVRDVPLMRAPKPGARRGQGVRP